MKTIIYDFDGTIGNTNQLIYDSFVHTFTHFNIPFDDELIYSAFGPTLHQTFSRFGKNEEEIGAMISFYRDFNISHHDVYVKAFPNVLETVKKLAKMGVNQCVVSSKKTDLVYRGLYITELLPYMKVVVGADEVSKHKPDPEGINLVLRMVKDNGAVVVGDNPSDILSAKNANCISVGVGWSVKLAELKRANPDYMIDDFSEMIKIVGDELDL